MSSLKDVTAVITVVGKDQIGIIAAVSQILSQQKVNIKDISQTIMKDTFTMIMLVDLTDCSSNFQVLSQALTTAGETLHVSILIQRTEIFNAMHRI